MGNYYNPSDANLKDNVTSITNANSIINQLNPVTFDYKVNDYDYLNLPTSNQMGLIAQQVEQILPNLVQETTHPAQYDSLGNEINPVFQFKSLDYEQLIPILIAGIKEQYSELDSLEELVNSQDSINNDLEDRLAVLEQCIEEANICNTGNKVDPNNSDEGTVIELSNLNAIILDQNLPNPFKEKTTINYAIPEEVMEAQLLFYDLNGRVIKQVDITERGEGKITVYGENLQNGIYTYSLIADGQLIATKKMVKSK